MTNLMLHLRHASALRGAIKYNEFTDVVEWRGKPLEEPDYVDIRMELEREQYQPNERDVRAGVDRVSRENAYNPVVDYLTGLSWDGNPRLHRWMQRLLGAPDTPFVKLIGPKVLISAVARALAPGAKVDTMLVLEGQQGIKKSSAIAELFGAEYTVESVGLFDHQSKMVMQLMGAWAVELAEFVAIAKKDQNLVKGLISMRSDRVVLSYARRASSHPRRFVFFATINPDESGYLTDNTGNRRYWPVTITKVDLPAIAAARDQLWAEAVHRHRDGERWWLEGDEEELAVAETGDREEVDAWEEILSERLLGISEITTAGALGKLGIPTDRIDKRAQMRAAAALKKLEFKLTTPKGPDRKTFRLWVRDTSP